MNSYVGYLYLALAIIVEVIATSFLKVSEEFTKLLPTLVVIFGYILSFYLMTLALRTIPLGITYAVWSGMGIVLISIVGALFYGEYLNQGTIIGMGLILIGILVVHLYS